LNNVGFLTLTFPDNVTDHAEAHRRFKGFSKRVLTRFFGAWLCVKERQVRGAWHFHLLIDCRTDIRSGINWQEIMPPPGRRPRYGSASPPLRSLWRLLRERLPAYGFGRHELLPIRTVKQAVALYMSKYIGKHLSARQEQDKGVRLVNSSRDWLQHSVRMAWNSDGSKEWRRKLAKLAALVDVADLAEMKAAYGSRWAYHLAPVIVSVDDYHLADLRKLLASRTPYPLPDHGLDGPDLVDFQTGEILF